MRRVTGVRNKGISLLEALVALTILNVAIWVMLDLFPASLVSVSSAGNTYLATELAQHQLEGWIQKGYGWIVAQPSSLSGVTTVTREINGRTRNTPFNWQFSHTATTPGEVEQIGVLVSWPQKMGFGATTKSVRLVSRISR